MLAPDVVERIGSLLAAGRMSQREIARFLRISRGTVVAIAHGRRPDYSARSAAALRQGDAVPGPVERCPGCGAMVRMPCLACRLRASRRLRRFPHDRAP